MTGPCCASMTRRVAMTSSANDNVGIWTMLTWWPSRVRMLCTPSQPEPSTQPPWTTTTFNPFVFFIERFPFFATHHARAELQVGDQEFLNNMPACSGMLTDRNNVPHASGAPWELMSYLRCCGISIALCCPGLALLAIPGLEMAPLFDAPKGQETSGGGAG